VSKKRLPVLEDRLEHVINASVYVGDALHTLDWSIAMLRETSKEISRDFPSLSEKFNQFAQRLVVERETIRTYHTQLKEILEDLEREVREARGY